TKTAVSDVSLDVPDREFLVLLGPSGCGKSTLLRMLAGLESVSSGEIHLNQRRVDQLPPTARDMAFVFQSYALYPHMTVRRNITFPLIMRQFKWWFHLPIIGGMAKRHIEESPQVSDLVGRTAKILALTEMMDRFPRTLSGGQRQRVALGRAMVRQPEVFLMDEPLSNLDAKLRMSMRAEIIKLHRDVGGTFVYVTHDQIEAMTMADKIVVMRDGVVEQIGDPLSLYDHPVNTFVAGFIGSPTMNMIPGLARVNGNGAIVEFAGGVSLPAPIGARAADGQAVLYGVRPEHCRLTERAGFPADVVVVEPTGADTQLYCRFSGQELTSLVRDRVSCRPGDRVGLDPDPTHAHLFDAASGMSLGA
ncbi:MAG TPA: ATP-binding cassette domain-containing protein, partial [Casimicrobiaceae bacterium]|nr:ATP-binding cassette domain-containing protein [Casimicrobiaceae bacterium]